MNKIAAGCEMESASHPVAVFYTDTMSNLVKALVIEILSRCSSSKVKLIYDIALRISEDK